MKGLLYVDIEPHEDENFIVQRKLQELGGNNFTPFCSFCRRPTSYIVTWKPLEPQQRLATRVPKGVDRYFFFPACAPCSRVDHAETELQWKAIEQINVNVPLEDGHRFYH